MDKEIFIENEVYPLMLRGKTEWEAREEAEKRFNYLYSDEDCEKE